MTTTTLIQINQALYPQAPADSDLRFYYDALRKDAQTLNRSRGQIVRRKVELEAQIERLEAELQEYAKDAALDMQERAQLLGILSKYRDIFAAMEKAGDDMVAGVEEYDLGRRAYYGGGHIARLIGACRAFVVAWKQMKEMGKQDLNQIGAGV